MNEPRKRGPLGRFLRNEIPTVVEAPVVVEPPVVEPSVVLDAFAVGQAPVEVERPYPWRRRGER